MNSETLPPVGDDRLVCLVSGGSRGLGEAIVTQLLDQGHSVATFSRAKPTAFIEKCLGGDTKDRFMWQQADATDAAATKKFAFAVRKHFGRLDALVNNVGVAVEGLFTMTPMAEIQRAIQLNLESVIQLTQVCTKIMLTRRSGKILSISSINAVRGFKGLGPYAATKAALDGMTRALARELGPQGIQVNSIAPGFMDTDMTKGMSREVRARILRRTPLGELATVEEVAATAVFMLSPAARSITGQTIVVDGGLSC